MLLDHRLDQKSIIRINQRKICNKSQPRQSDGNQFFMNYFHKRCPVLCQPSADHPKVYISRSYSQDLGLTYQYIKDQRDRQGTSQLSSSHQSPGYGFKSGMWVTQFALYSMLDSCSYHPHLIFWQPFYWLKFQRKQESKAWCRSSGVIILSS